MTHSAVSSRHNGPLGDSRPADVVISRDGTRIYTSGVDGSVRVYHAETGALLATWAVGTKLGAIDLSPDGSFLLVLEAEPVSSFYASNWTDNRFTVAVHKIDTATGEVTTLLHNATGYEWAFNDVSIFADGTALLTQKAIPGWSAWVQPELLDTRTGTFTTINTTIRHHSIISDNAAGSSALVAEYNNSDAGLRTYTQGNGFTSVHQMYQDNVSGFNNGAQAMSGEAGLIAQFVAGNGLHIYNASLQYQRDLTDTHPALIDNIAALAFDSTGAFLFVLDAETDTLVQLSTSTWEIVSTLAIGQDIVNTFGDFGSRLIVGPSMRYFTVVTDTGLLQLDNPAVSSTIRGTAGNDTLTGTSLHDVFDGGDGADTLKGGAGDDVYLIDQARGPDTIVELAGEGIDEIRIVSGYLDISGIAHVENVAVLSADPASTSYVQGNSGDNVIVGSAGNDHLSDATKGGSDRLYGRDGDDFLYLTRGGWQTGAESYVLDGGAGNDRMLLSLADWTQTASMIGGDGDDQFEIGRGAVVKVDGGAGDDRILLRDLGAAITITLGSGRDLIQFTTNTTFGDRGGSVVVTDFDFGGAGDRVEFVHYLRSVTTGWDPATNPFASQHLRLVQQGADAVLQRDSNGAAGGAAFVDMIRFAGVAAASLTHASLGGYHPDGSAPAGVTLNGTDGAESLWGTFRDDTIRGLGGDDRIDSGAGADRIEGGDGNDRLDGQFGDDVLFGEGGDDTLYETDGGNASLFGGAGKDAIIVEYAHGQAAATITMDGGADDDRLIFRGINRGGDTLSVSGGDGNDEIRITGFGTIDIDAGAGGDYLVLSSTAGLYSIALGGGRDTLVLENPWGNDTRLVFSDFFAAGPEAGGDILEMRKHLKSVLIGWDGVSDPFAGGFLRLTQKGADAVIEIDSDGTAGSGGYRELIRFQNGDAGALSAYNLDGLATFAINGSEDGETITAGAGDHQLNGLGGNDTLSGGAGKDRLDGGTGADTLRGGAGDDLFFVDDAGDLVVELAGEGVDEVRTALGSRSDPAKMYVMTANVEKFTGTSGSGQGVYGNASDNVMVMGAGADVVVLEGGGADTVFGNDGDDEFLFGNAFNNADKVDGGAGVDTLSLSGRYTLAFDADDVFGIEKLALSTSGNPAATFNYNLTMHDANVAAGGLLSVTGSSLTAAEKLIFNGAAETNGRFAVIGGAGADQLTGGAGNDTLEGRAGIDRLEGGAGDDRLDGGGAADTMIGGTGNDLYLVDSIRDVVTELAGEGLDEVRTALGSSADVTSTYLLPDHVENLTGTSTAGQRVSGNAQNNLITMGAGGDYVNLEGGGADQVFGNGGNDEFYWGSAFTNADRADGGAGVDTLRLRGTYTLTFDADDMFGIERLALSTSGNSAAPFSYNLTMHDANLAAGQQMTVVAQALGETETLVFNGSAETDGTFNIRGGKGADTITGGAGADQIFGNLGADLLRGGGGNDQFEYFSAAESTVAASDVIRDFTKGDRVNLTAIDADGDPTNGNSTFTWLGSGAFTKQAGQLRLFQHPEYTRSWGVEADIDGDGAADMLIYLVGPPGFVPDLSDFYL